MILIIFVLFLLFFIDRIIKNSGFSPHSFFTYYWGGFIIISLPFYNERYWFGGGLFWITLSIIALYLGYSTMSYIINVNFITKKTEKKVRHYHNWRLLFILICLAILSSVFTLIGKGLDTSSLKSFESFVSLNTEIAYERYNINQSTNLFNQISLVLAYASPLCAGFMNHYVKNFKQRVLIISSFLPTLMILLTTNTKAGTIASIFLFVSGIIVSYLLNNKQYPKMKLSTLVKSFTGAVTLFILLYFSMLLRIGDFTLNSQMIVFEKFKLYALGHIPAFDIWVSSENQSLFSLISNYTFQGPISFLGLNSKTQGIFNEVSPVGTNVYTAFRGIIEDFGLIGGLGFHFILGAFAAFNIHKILCGGESSLNIVFLTSIYFYILFSFTVSPWSYMSFVLTFVVFHMFLIVSSRLYNSNEGSSEAL
ncbi:O-antigen polymerase [Exiguobacterium sp. AT1b]|uniref:O-antigen polymerase n=1 Tax=Exiguobacterium sp. (strain ATCC BAA-1283 / AT1b) TaxID=360911 RepID=UPI00093C4D68|nr:O-antigen polymerase [Exiguobacterium sp. AT1b]